MLALFVLPILVAASPLQLSTQPVGAVRLAGDVKRFELASDDGRAVYLTDPATAGTQQLWSVAIDGRSDPVRLDQDLLGKVDDFRVSPTGTSVAYLGDRDVLGSYQLFIVPADGSAAPLELSGPLFAGGRVQAFEFTSDGAHVVYEANQDSADRELYSVLADGSAPAIKLSAPFTGVALRALTPNGERALFGAPGTAGEKSVRIDGSLAPDSLDLALIAFRKVLITPDSQRAVFHEMTFGGHGPDPVRLHVVSVDEGVPLMLGGNYVRSDSVLAPAAGRIVFRDNMLYTFLYSVSLDGGPIVRLNEDTFTITSVRSGFQVAGSSALYIGNVLADNKYELFRVPVDGSGPSVRLSHTLSNAGDVTAVLLDPTATRALYVAYFGTLQVNELFSVPVAGGTQVKLSGPMVTGGDVVTTAVDDGFVMAAAFDPEGSEVLYLADQEVDGKIELYRAPIDGHKPARKVNGPLVPAGDVQGDFRFGRGHHVLFRADASVDGVYELFVARPKALGTN